MNDSNVHVATHPTGEPNRTAVNAENPIFGRPADPITEVSIQQAAVVQSEKNPRETVQSPLINEEVERPSVEADPSLAGTGSDTEPASDSPIASGETAEPAQDSSPSAEDLDAVAGDGSLAPNVETKEYADGSSATGTAPLPNLSPEEQAAAQAQSGDPAAENAAQTE